MKGSEKIILGKIRTYAQQAVQFAEGMDFTVFSGDAKTVSACVFNLSQIGELVGKLSPEFTERIGHIPWRKIRGMRNKIVHDYEGIQLNIVWDVLADFLPEFITNLGELL